MSSGFSMDGHQVSVKTIAHPDTSTIAVRIDSSALSSGDVEIFFDYPYMGDAGLARNKFEAPFVGNYTAVNNHTTRIKRSERSALITHTEDGLTYFTAISWAGEASISGALPMSHRYVLSPKTSGTFSFTVTY